MPGVGEEVGARLAVLHCTACTLHTLRLPCTREHTLHAYALRTCGTPAHARARHLSTSAAHPHQGLRGAVRAGSRTTARRPSAWRPLPAGGAGCLASTPRAQRWGAQAAGWHARWLRCRLQAVPWGQGAGAACAGAEPSAPCTCHARTHLHARPRTRPPPHTSASARAPMRAGAQLGRAPGRQHRGAGLRGGHDQGGWVNQRLACCLARAAPIVVLTNAFSSVHRWPWCGCTRRLTARRWRAPPTWC